MREPWQIYLMMFIIVALMLLGKKMMFFSNDKEDSKKNEPKDKNWLILRLLTLFSLQLQYKDGTTIQEW